MMSFNSSVLKEQTGNQNSESYMLERCIKEEPESFIPALLEFNETMHEIDVKEKINYYKSLVLANNSSSLSVQKEAAVAAGVGISALIGAALGALIGLISNLIENIRKGGNKAATAQFESEYKAYENRARSNPNVRQTEGQYKVYTIKNKNCGKFFAASCNLLMNNIDLALSNRMPDGWENKINNDITGAYKVLKKEFAAIDVTGDISDHESFMKALQNARFYSFDDQTKTLGKMADSAEQFVLDEKNHPLFDVPNNLQYLNKYIADAKRKSESANIDQNVRDFAKATINALNGIAKDITAFVNKFTKETIAIKKYYIQCLKQAGKDTSPVETGAGYDGKESALIHGEEFDGDTLFANDDIRDFNRTEWLDLELTTEGYEFLAAIEEYRRSVALQEALIFTESNSSDRFQKLLIMQEAEKKKLGDTFSEIIKHIIEAVDKFFSQLSDSVSLNTHFIKKNEAILLNKPLKFTKLTSKGDILTGLDRIQQPTVVSPYNYEAMQEDLKDEKTFFLKHIQPKSLSGGLPTVGGTKVDWNDVNLTVSELCTIYFGGPINSLEDGTGFDIKAGWDAKKKNIIEFLKNPSMKLNKIRNEIRELKAEADKVTKNANAEAARQQQEQNAGQQQQSNTPPTGGQQTTQESMYYSELFQRWFTEADMETDPKDDPKSDESKEYRKDNKAAFKSYLGAYKGVLLAKLTAASFIRSEFLSIAKAHVKNYGGDTSNNNGGAPQQQGGQQQPAPQQNNNAQ